MDSYFDVDAMKAVQLSLPEGLALQALGLERLEEAHPELLSRLRAVAIAIAEREGEVTADQVRAIVPLPADISHNVMGAVFQDRRFHCVDWRRSEQPQRHGNRVAVWRLK